jgi:uncharacterized Fe-S cluster-containing radical SAM superfamily protein
MASGTAYHELDFLRSTWNKCKVVGFNPRYFFYRMKWNFLGKYPIRTKVPIHVDIELSSHCNLKCSMCPHGKTNYDMDKGLLDYELARKVIDECAHFGVISLKFSGRGEALLHPRFTELAQYAKSRGLVDVMFNTNGLLLSEDKIRAVVDGGVDLVIISIDGASKEVYEKIRIGGDFKRLIHNIEYLIEYRKRTKRSKPMIRLQFVKMKENIHEFDSFKKMWRDKVDVLVGLDYSDRVGKQDWSTQSRRTVGRSYCPHPWRRLTVTSEAKALMCCVDWDVKYAVGDCRQESIYDIWNGKPIRYGRSCIKRLEHHKIPSCRECFAPVSYKWERIKTKVEDENRKL